MPWPYLFFTFTTCTLVKAGFPGAGIISALAAAGFLLTDMRRSGGRFIAAYLAVGITLGGFLFSLRLPYISVQDPVPTQGTGNVVGISKKSLLVRTDAGIKLRLTGLKKEAMPPKQARVQYRCEPQEMPASAFAIFERLSGVALWCRTAPLQVVSLPGSAIWRVRHQVLAWLDRRFAAMPERSLIGAFLLGDTDDLTEHELQAFRDMGLMHLFAVSGLNIALLFGIIYLPFRFAGVPAVGSALGYTVATGFLLLLDFPVPLLRAWLFMTISLGMRLIDRRIPSWTLLFLTAIIVEVLFPLSTFSMSFILSFGVTAAILVFYQPFYFCFAAKNKWRDLLGQHTALTLAAGLPAMLIGFLLFGGAQPLSLLYNLLLVPFSGLYLFGSLVFLLFEPAKYLLTALDAVYLKFASWHMAYVSSYFPSANQTGQILSLCFIALLLVALYVLKRRRRLWSARRNLRYVIPVSAIALLSPYLAATYPGAALYAVPNKVWFYKEKKLLASGSPVFADGKTSEPRACFPIVQKSEVPGDGSLPPEIMQIEGRCFVFTGRMKPENWPATVLKNCSTLDVFQSRKMQTGAREWDELFKMFGYRGRVSIRKFFTWYADKPLACEKAEPL